MKKILIIGGYGYLGSFLVKKLRNKNIINLKKKKLNILNKNHLDKYLDKNISCIINLSGQIGKLSDKINLNGNKNILKIIKKKNIKPILIYISTTLVNTYLENKFKKIKSNIFNNKYCKSKYDAENFIKKNYNNFIICRVSNIYDNEFKKGGILKNIISSIKSKKLLKVSNTETSRNYIHIIDVSNQIQKLIKFSNKTKNKKFITLANENFKIIEIIKLFEKAAKCKISYKNLKKDLKIDYSQKIFSNSLKFTSHKNKYSLSKTIKRYYVK